MKPHIYRHNGMWWREHGKWGLTFAKELRDLARNDLSIFKINFPEYRKTLTIQEADK